MLKIPLPNNYLNFVRVTYYSHYISAGIELVQSEEKTFQLCNQVKVVHNISSSPKKVHAIDKRLTQVYTFYRDLRRRESSLLHVGKSLFISSANRFHINQGNKVLTK